MNHSDQLQGIIDEYADLLSDNHCVYKLFYSVKGAPDVFVVIMGKNFFRSLNSVKYDLGYYFKNQFAERETPNIYIDFYKYIFDHPYGEFYVQFLHAGKRPYDTLKAAHTFLNTDDGGRRLNSNVSPPIPKATQRNNKLRGWINRGHFLNFKIWQAKFDASRKKPA